MTAQIVPWEHMYQVWAFLYVKLVKRGRTLIQWVLLHAKTVTVALALVSQGPSLGAPQMVATLYAADKDNIIEKTEMPSAKCAKGVWRRMGRQQHANSAPLG